MTIAEYLSHLNRLYLTGHAREHSYRGDLQTLLSTLLPDILVINEPARVSCGAPDYMLSRKGVPVGYVEAKDIGVDLDSKERGTCRGKLKDLSTKHFYRQTGIYSYAELFFNRH